MTLLLVLVAASTMGAQRAPSSDLSASDTREMIHRYGECVIRTQQQRASEAILANVDNATLLTKYSELVVPRCMVTLPGSTVSIRFTGDQYRYALADALVRKELAGQPAPDVDMVARLDHREPGASPSGLDEKGKPLSKKDLETAQEAYREAQAYNFLSRYGECVVRRDPAAAKALLLTTPNSDAEKASFPGMSTALATCLPPGQTLSFGKSALRGTIAVNYYRLAKAPRLPAEPA